MKSLNELIRKPEADDVCQDKHLSSNISLNKDFCIDIPVPPLGICDLNPPIDPTLPATICTDIGPIMITCTEIMGSCGGGVITPQSTHCDGGPTFVNGGCAIM